MSIIDLNDLKSLTYLIFSFIMLDRELIDIKNDFFISISTSTEVKKIIYLLMI